MGSVDDLTGAVRAARAATEELLVRLVAHQMVPGLLNLRPAPYWPAPVRSAYVHWKDRINDVAGILAHRQGLATDARMGDDDRTAVLLRAYVLGLDLDD